MNPLKQLEVCGQSPWLDYLKRSLIKSGELRRLVERDGLKGVTSNPSIFEKAIAESDDYADAIKEFQAEGCLRALDRAMNEIDAWLLFVVEKVTCVLVKRSIERSCISYQDGRTQSRRT